jgi:hypothetical protein
MFLCRTQAEIRERIGEIAEADQIDDDRQRHLSP